MKTHCSFVSLSVFALLAALAFAVNANPAQSVSTFVPVKGELELKSSATATWMRFIDVYEAALYAPAGVTPDDIASEALPLSLELAYLTSVSKDNIIKAADVALQRQHDPARLAQYAAQVTQLHESYRDVGKGDRYRLDLDPAKGVGLYLNDEELVYFADADFGRFYIGIWLDEPPLSQPLRTALLSWN